MASGIRQSGVAEEIIVDGVPAQKESVFKHFDIVTDFSDHHFHSNKRNGVSCDQLKIMQEWKILEKNLPESIYVRVYEERIDLLRAVIVGASGTPYHDSLFFFDLAFPSDYPNHPPKLHYHSHNLRLNPNLYAGGYVCLSLLNTWYGKKNQKWNPSQSTILQVLVSLQALVLNERPYFNEPGISPNGWRVDQASVSYSENVFLLSCRTMLYSMKKPPKNFEIFVAEHFRGRADVILAACKAYTKGHAKVGYFYVDEGPSSSVTQVSAKFKSSMNKLYKELDAAFAMNSTHFLNYAGSSGQTGDASALWSRMAAVADRETVVKKMKKNKNKNLKFMKFCGKMKWLLGFHKIIKKPKKTAVLTK